MYKSIEQIQKLRGEKQGVLSRVYQSSNLDSVYENQRELGAMSISIFTDAADVVLPVLRGDGVGNVVWSNISLRLDKLSFISVPTAAEIREKYKKSVENPTVIEINGATPKPGTRTEVKKIPLPAFAAALVAQGIAIPLFFGTKLALVKILGVVDAACMVIEVLKYFDWFPKKNKKTLVSPPKADSADNVDYEDMYKEAIQEVYRDNCKRLDAWFDQLEKITIEEIDKALRKVEG